MKSTDRTACFRRPGGLRNTRRRPLHERDALTIFRRVLSRLRESVRDLATTGPVFGAATRAVCELHDHRRRFHRNATAPPLEPHPRLAEARAMRLALADAA